MVDSNNETVHSGMRNKKTSSNCDSTFIYLHCRGEFMLHVKDCSKGLMVSSKGHVREKNMEIDCLAHG